MSGKEVGQEGMIITIRPAILPGMCLIDKTINMENEICAEIFSTTLFITVRVV